MKKFKLVVSNEYEVEAEDEDDAIVKLGERFDVENMTAETEFWDSISVYPAGDCEFGHHECIHKSTKVCNSCEQKDPSNLEVQ